MMEPSSLKELRRQNAIMRKALERYANRYEWGGTQENNLDELLNPNSAYLVTQTHWLGAMYRYKGQRLTGGWSIAEAALKEIGVEVPFP